MYLKLKLPLKNLGKFLTCVPVLIGRDLIQGSDNVIRVLFQGPCSIILFSALQVLKVDFSVCKSLSVVLG